MLYNTSALVERQHASVFWSYCVFYFSEDWLYNLPWGPTTAMLFKYFDVWLGHSWILYLKKGFLLTFVLFLVSFYETVFIPIKNKQYGEGHILKFYEQ